MATPVAVLTGPLGSGKTTVLNHIMSLVVNKRVAVIINDFGAINMDAALVSRSEWFKQAHGVVGLGNMCVCCTGSSELQATLEQLSGVGLDGIIVESSGVSSAESILECVLGVDSVSLDSLVCVVDATTLDVCLDDSATLNSLQACDVVVANKCDLLEPSAPNSTLAELREALGNDATIFLGYGGQAPVDLVFPSLSSSKPADATSRDRCTPCSAGNVRGHLTGLAAAAWSGGKEMDPCKLAEVHQLDGSWNLAARIKGVVHLQGSEGVCCVVQGTRRRLSLSFEPGCSCTVLSQLVVIGDAEQFGNDKQAAFLNRLSEACATDMACGASKVIRDVNPLANQVGQRFMSDVRADPRFAEPHMLSGPRALSSEHEQCSVAFSFNPCLGVPAEVLNGSLLERLYERGDIVHAYGVFIFPIECIDPSDLDDDTTMCPKLLPSRLVAVLLDDRKSSRFEEAAWKVVYNASSQVMLSVMSGRLCGGCCVPPPDVQLPELGLRIER